MSEGRSTAHPVGVFALPFSSAHTRRQILVLSASAVAGAALPKTVRLVGQTTSGTFRATAATTTAELNKWLASGSTAQVKRLTGVAKLTAPLVLRSGTTLDATGATITGPALDNIVKNTATIPSARATVSVTAGSTTVTATTAVFTAAMVGRRIQVLGVGPASDLRTAPGSLYGTIVSATSAHEIVLDTPATSSGSGVTASVFPVAYRGITVRGGTWINQNKNRLSQTTQSHGFFLRRITGLTISGVTVKSTGAKQLGGQYAICIGDCTDVQASQLTFVDTASDGIHVQGPAARVSIQNVVGTGSGDDLVAFTGVDGQSQPGSLLGDCEGDIVGVTVRNVTATQCRSVLKITSGLGANRVRRTISQFTASGLFGTSSSGSPVNIVNYAGDTTFSGTIQNVTATSKTNGPAVYVKCAALGQLVVDGVVWPACVTAAPTDGIVHVNCGNVGTAVIRNVINRSVAGSRTDLTSCGVKVRGAAIDTLTVTDVSCPVVAPHFDAVQLGAANTSIRALTIAKESSSAATGNVLYIPATSGGYSLPTVTVTDVTRATGSVFVADADGAATPMALSVTRMTGGKAVALLRSAATVTVTALIQPAGAGAAVRANSPAASPVRVVEDASTRPSTLLSRTATQELSAVSHTIPVDTAILTPRHGDVVLSTTGAAGQPGMVAYDDNDGTWKEETEVTG
jgi:hypothetical protein